MTPNEASITVNAHMMCAQPTAFSWPPWKPPNATHFRLFSSFYRPSRDSVRSSIVYLLFCSAGVGAFFPSLALSLALCPQTSLKNLFALLNGVACFVYPCFARVLRLCVSSFVLEITHPLP